MLQIILSKFPLSVGWRWHDDTKIPICECRFSNITTSFCVLMVDLKQGDIYHGASIFRRASIGLHWIRALASCCATGLGCWLSSCVHWNQRTLYLPKTRVCSNVCGLRVLTFMHYEQKFRNPTLRSRRWPNLSFTFYMIDQAAAIIWTAPWPNIFTNHLNNEGK